MSKQKVSEELLEKNTILSKQVDKLKELLREQEEYYKKEQDKVNKRQVDDLTERLEVSKREHESQVLLMEEEFKKDVKSLEEHFKSVEK